ncbi:MAG: hypothetical protein SWX82_24515, partial [Cyanobacteriota bacterium]|nr:hypothetical protein [Cyanobacteriota bacterium]
SNWIMELISDGSISNHITKEIYQFLFEFFSNLKLFPNNSIEGIRTEQLTAQNFILDQTVTDDDVDGSNDNDQLVVVEMIDSKD